MRGLLSRLDAAAEELLYPDIPDPNDREMRRSSARERVFAAVDDPLDWPMREQLQHLDIPDLYTVLEQMAHKRGTLPLIRESIRGQVALATELTNAISQIRNGKVDYKEANRIIQDCEQSFLQKLQDAGLNVEYKSEVSPEEIEAKPALILATHQGGGGENYIHQAITGIRGRLIVKDALTKIPYIRDGLKARKAVPVKRDMLRHPRAREYELYRIATSIVEELMYGGNMYVFIEGTRSRNGEVAATDKRKAWASDLLAAIEEVWEEYREDGYITDQEYQKLLLVFNTKIAMPDAPEETLFKTRFRTSGTTLSARLMHADDLSIEESDDPYDSATLFGKARATLKEILIQIIERQGRET